jgi:tetratricopeptide (TPR) repeat protein
MEESKNKIEKSKEFFFKAYKCQMDGKYNDAIRNYKISLALFPTVEAHTFLGWAYSYLGEYDKAIEECKNAIEIDPDNGNPFNDIGAYMMKLGKHDESIPWFELALKAKKCDNPEYAHINIGLALERKGLWFEALDEYKIALEIVPDYKPAKQCLERVQGLLN